MRDDTVYWQTQSDGTTKGEFAYRYTELSTLVMKLYYRLLDALEDEALAYIETQQVARNGCEVLRLLKSRYALETQYIETDLITKVHTWTFDKNDLERSIIEWERLIHRLSTQHNFKFEPRQLFAILIRGLPEDLRLTMNRDGVVEFLALRGRVIEYCRNKRLSDPIHSNEVNSAMMCPVRKGTTKGVDEENKEKARVRKNMIMHRCSITFSMVIHDLIFMCHCQYRTLSDWYEEAGNHENRPREKHRIELRRVWQLRYEKEHRKEEARKDEIIRLHIPPIHGVSHRIHGMRQVRRILGIDR